MLSQSGAAHPDAEQLPGVGVEAACVGGRQPIEIVAEQWAKPLVSVRQMYYHAQRGQASQVARSRNDAGMERRGVFEVVDSAQPAQVVPTNDALDLDAGRQQLQRPQRRHLAPYVAPPANRVVAAEVEGGNRTRPPRLGAYPAAPHRALEMPPSHPPLVGLPPPHGVQPAQERRGSAGTANGPYPA